MARILNATSGEYNPDETVEPYVAYDRTSGEAVAIETTGNTADIVSLDTRIDTAEAAITSLDGRLDIVEGDITVIEAALADDATDIAALQTAIAALTAAPTPANITLQNGWVVAYPGSYSNARYFKSPQGIVYVQGTIKQPDGVNLTDKVIGNLPVGFRPARYHVFNCAKFNGACQIEVGPNGNLVIYNGSDYYSCIDGVTFLADHA